MLPDTELDWQRVRLGDIVAIERSSKSAAEIRGIDKVTLFSLPAFDDGGRPVEVAGNSIESGKYVVPSDCVLFSKLNPRIPRVWRVTHSSSTPALGSTEFWPLKPRGRDVVDLDYLAHFLRSPAFLNAPSILPASSTNSHQRVDRAAFESYELALPPLQEQRRIAEILASVDEAIQTTQTVIEQNRVVKSALMKRLLSAGTGIVTENDWTVDRIDRFFVLQRGFDLTEKRAIKGDVPVYSSSGLSYFHNVPQVAGPAVITGRKGKLGSVYFVDRPCWPHDTSLWVKDFKGNDPKFVFWFLQSLQLEKFDAATAVPTLNRNNVHSLIVKFPPLQEQKAICAVLDGLSATEEPQTDILDRTVRLKSAMMSDLLTGRRRVTTNFSLAAE
jgi:type I restriction enzyme S subunit